MKGFGIPVNPLLKTFGVKMDDPRDAFDFSVDRWNEQLVSGYSKITPARGLKVHMPDYNDLPRHQTH